MKIVLDPNSISDYRLFIKAKSLPQFKCRGREIEVPDEYADLLGHGAGVYEDQSAQKYKPTKGLYDYQRDISRLAIRKRKFAIFAEPGRGKTLMMAEYIKHVLGLLAAGKCILWVAPPMVVKQTMQEVASWYDGKFLLERVQASNLADWLTGRRQCRVGITNYQALRDDTPQGDLGALVFDESQSLRNHYGSWAGTALRLGDGLEWKLCATGTPAPNDRIEFANHAVFLDASPTVNAFLAKYFVNRGQTDNRWEMKKHAVGPFYRDLSAWCIFLTNPATYGWRDGIEPLPPIHVHVHDVELTDEQNEAVYKLTNRLFLDNPGGIVKRAKLSRIGKGEFNGQKLATRKNEFIRELVATWPDESTLIWCHFNNEQKEMERIFPNAGSISGSTPEDRREQYIEEFQAGTRKQVISKPAILGLGLNLQIATRQVFSGMNDSYEQFVQAIKRSNRIGSTKPLNVHVPVTDLERPQWNNVLRKADRVQADLEEQEREFKERGIIQW